MPSDYVVLRDGRAMPLAMLRYLWALEARGVTFRLADDNRVVARPAALLDQADKDWMAANKPWLVSILTVDVQAPA